MKFGGKTSIALGEETVGEKKVTFGVSSMLLSSNFLGVEGDLEQIPQFFGPGLGRTVTSSGVTTLTGNVIFGVSSMLLSSNFLGVEGDLEQIPQFFGPGLGRTVTSSGVTTLTGNVIIAVPKAITQESLRPYAVSYTHLTLP